MKRSDRRFAQRFNLNVPLNFRRWHSSEPGEDTASVNVSESGVYFETTAPPDEGASVHLRIAMPPEITGGQAAEWSCTGKVVRVKPVSVSGSALGVAVRFSYYEVAEPSGKLSRLPAHRTEGSKTFEVRIGDHVKKRAYH